MPVSINDVRTAPAGEARSDVFLSLTTKRAGKIKGEATTAGHEDDIEIVGWGWGVQANTAIGSGAATARRSYKHLSLVKGIDAASTGLLSALASNDEVREAKLTMRKAGGEALDYFVMTLAGARVVAVDIEVGAGGVPIEHVSIAFAKVDIEYQRQETAGIGSGACSFSDEAIPGG